MSGDPAEARLMLIHERSHARRSIAAGVISLASLVPAMWIGVMTNDVVLLAASVYMPIALVFGVRWTWTGIRIHATASLALLRLHRDTGLPPARLV